MALGSGSKVDRFTLVEPIAEGGQGEVWKAKDPLEPGAPRALKLINPAAASTVDLERIRREARALSQLEHPSLVRCHGLFEDVKVGVLGLVMDYVDGASLAAIAEGDRFTKALRMALLSHVAAALAHVHDRGLVHRDLKLDNVLVTTSFWDEPGRPENVKLVDFGIATTHGNPEPLTRLGSVIGTAPFMAPERVDPAFHGSSDATAAADVFAFGVVAWQLLVGGHPTGIEDSDRIVDYAVKYREALGRAWPPKKLGGFWGDVLDRCLAIRVEARFPSAELIVRSLEDRAAAPLPTAEAQAPPGSTAPDGALARRSAPITDAAAPPASGRPSKTVDDPSAPSVRTSGEHMAKPPPTEPDHETLSHPPPTQIALPKTIRREPGFRDSAASVLPSAASSPLAPSVVSRPSAEGYGSDPRASIPGPAVSRPHPHARAAAPKRGRIGTTWVLLAMLLAGAAIAIVAAMGFFEIEPDLEFFGAGEGADEPAPAASPAP